MTTPTAETQHHAARRPAGAAMPRILLRFAGGAGILIGLMSVVVGGATLLGLREPGYLTLDWLLMYNIALGVVSLGVGAAILFRRPWSPAAALGIAASHAMVLVVVAALFTSSGAASDSVGAMVFRTVAWLLVAATAWGALRRKPQLSPERERMLQ